MRDPHTVVRAPLITEKSTFGIEHHRAYCFEVASDANKIEIGQAVEAIFDVKVLAVNTMWKRGKRKRVGRSIGMTKKYKKAIVTLAPGHKIDLI
ncbi:MAG: 50S ribosomal protein L23 [Planctomycetes bacterium]|nr:50S ribosomal protein L23 [Planctomycetota bacterium]